MDFSIFLMLFVVGTIAGSFLNMLVYRIPHKMSLVSPGSFCDHCKNPLRWYENVPVISYVVTFGKCQTCGERYSGAYVFIEILTGLLFVAIYAYAIDIFHFLYLASLMTILFGIFLIDIKHYIIPNKLLIAAIVISLLYYWYISGLGIYVYLLSAVIIFAVLFLLRLISGYIYHREAFGMGDVKLGALLGFILSWKAALLAIFFGFLTAGLVLLVLAILHKIKRNSYIPFGPFLITGMIINLFFGKLIVVWYLNLFYLH